MLNLQLSYLIDVFHLPHQEGESFLNSDCSLRTTCTNNTLIKDGYRCGDNASCETTGGVTSCNCNEWFEGDGLTCTRSGPLDCHDLYIANRTTDNTYTIHPAGLSGFEVYCDMTNGGWTVSHVCYKRPFLYFWINFYCFIVNIKYYLHHHIPSI